MARTDALPPAIATPTEGQRRRLAIAREGRAVTVEDAIEVARRAGFELIHVERLRPHYALTLKAWVERLEANAGRARELVGEEVFRTWRLYMAAACRGFEDGSLDVAQLLLARPGTAGPAGLPLRPWWHG